MNTQPLKPVSAHAAQRKLQRAHWQMRVIALLICSVLVSLLPSVVHAAPTVEAFSPQGTVKSVRQVAVRFSAPMVRFGDPRTVDPFTIDCAAAGRGRWADARNWVYDFDEDLPAGLRCSFQLKPELSTASGTAVGDTRRFSFDTGGPAIRASLPSEGSGGVDEAQVFVLALDAPADEASIAAHAYCVVSGLGEKIPLQVLSGNERRSVLAQRRQLGYAYYELLWKNGRQSFARVRDHRMEQAEARLLVTRCARSLPPATTVQLVWGAGIKTVSGIATTLDQTLVFQTRPAFNAAFSCERVNPRADCLPMRPMTLDFSAPIAHALAERIRLIGRDQRYKPKLDDADRVESVSFAGPFPERVHLRLELPAGLVDDAGRALANAARFPLDVATSEAPALVKFGADFGILERSEGGVLPVTLRNVEPVLEGLQSQLAVAAIDGRSQKIDDDAQIARWLRRIQVINTPSGDWQGEGAQQQWIENTGAKSVFSDADATRAFTLPKPNGAQAFEVVGIPLREPGFYVVELKSPKLGAALLGDGRVRYVATSALVTNLAVHFEWGRESSLVFVTTLDTAQPVANAEIRISDACDGKVLWNGHTDASGRSQVDAGLPAPPNWNDGCDNRAEGDRSEDPLIISARTGDDMSFALSSWNRGISPGDFQLPGAYASADDATLAHTVLDRALFRAGETVSMKHFLREHVGSGLALSKTLPVDVLLRHQGSDQTYTLPLQWRAGAVAESSWEIPKDAKLGTYDIELRYAADTRGDRRELSSGAFRVEQFRVPSMRAILQAPKQPLVNADTATLDIFVSYLSGGAASNLPVKLRTQLQPKTLQFPGYEAFRFGGPEIKPGIDTGGGERDDDDEDGASNDGDSSATPAQLQPLTLDSQGSVRATVPKLAKSGEPQDLVAEVDYQDASGEMLTSATRIALWPSAVVLGVKPDGWIATKDDLRFKVLALDLRGHPLAQQRIRVDGFRRVTHSYRRRLVGGFYAYDNSAETIALGELCAGRTDEKGLLSCKVQTAESGQIELQASSADASGNRALASTELWVAGGDDWWFDAAPSDRMDVLPEAPSYESGQVARFQVRMPFRDATALVTVEREGVIDSFVTTLSGRDPVLEVPIKDSYAPNVFVSVLALRGRIAGWRARLADLVHWLHLPFQIEGGSPTALVDLGKPAYRLGIAQINVGWSPHRLDVRVTPSSDTFKVRDQAQVSIAVQAPHGMALPADAEVAVAAVDEGLLELLPNDSWKLLDAMMSPRGLEVHTATAQMQVIGKRHYGRKAGAPGGGGGRGPARELFDTLLLWRGHVPLDANGRATLSVPLNDSLSSFRIVAIASAGAQLFGTGSASIRTTQELQMISGLPTLLREGDHLSATLTLRNASNRAITATVGGSLDAGLGKAAPLSAQLITLAAGSAQELAWPVDVALGTQTLKWNFDAQEQHGSAADHLQLTTPVTPAVPIRTYQATLQQVDGSLQLPLERPSDALTGRGGIRVDLRAHLADTLDGVIEFMRAYPYSCFEQRASTAVALQDRVRWSKLMDQLPGYLDRDGLVRYFPFDELDGSETLTAYLLAIAQEAGWNIPDDSLARMQAGLSGFIAGRVRRYSVLETADFNLRKLAAIAALSRYGSATPAMLGSISIDPNLWPTSALLDWIDILDHVSALPEREARRTEALQILRSRLNFQGSTMGFSTERDDALWWLMIDGDVNAVRALLLVLNEPDWRDDVPRMARGALGRQQHAHWRTTVANAWGVLALEKFGAAFERATVGGTTHLTLAGAQQDLDWRQPPQPIELPWPAQAATLEVQQHGTGKPWALIESRAAIPLRAPLTSGYNIRRTVSPIEQKVAGRWTRGDVARVSLEIEAQSDMSWVVVDDPVPAGASVQGSGLGGSSTLLREGERQQGVAWLAFTEARADAYRAYYRFVPKGKWTLQYTLRFNSSGRFELPTTRVEAMYAPEMFGELPNAALQIDSP